MVNLEHGCGHLRDSGHFLSIISIYTGRCIRYYGR